jgi:hypothetical protein
MKTLLQMHINLISLKDVQIYFAKRLINVTASITSCHMIAMGRDNEKFTSKDLDDLKSCLSKIADESDSLSLPCTAIFAKRLIDEVNDLEANKGKIFPRIGELSERFEDETNGIKFFYVAPERLGWFESTQTAGEQFKANFPRANSELIEAGNCFALDRYTACVFHLTRVLEIVLSALHHALGIAEPADEHDKTWGRTLGRIQDKIKENDKSNPAGWSDSMEFYKKCHALLAAMKTPFRDSTVHVVSTYDESGASALLWAAVGALGHVATKLKEKP